MSEPNFAIIFDMDGTLLDTEKILLPALHQTFEVLRSRGAYVGDTPIETYIRMMGAPLPEVWRHLLTESSEEERQAADDLFQELLIAELREGRGVLHEGTKEALEVLHAMGLPLFVASNGLEPYIRACCAYLQLERYFADVYFAGRFEVPTKTEMVKHLLQKYGFSAGVMIGDRSSDIRAGADNGLRTIGCLFGFGDAEELQAADALVKRFEDLVPVVQAWCAGETR